MKSNCKHTTRPQAQHTTHNTQHTTHNTQHTTHNTQQQCQKLGSAVSILQATLHRELCSTDLEHVVHAQ
jgi:hypothetical protein